MIQERLCRSVRSASETSACWQVELPGTAPWECGTHKRNPGVSAEEAVLPPCPYPRGSRALFQLKKMPELERDLELEGATPHVAGGHLQNSPFDSARSQKRSTWWRAHHMDSVSFIHHEAQPSALRGNEEEPRLRACIEPTHFSDQVEVCVNRRGRRPSASSGRPRPRAPHPGTFLFQEQMLLKAPEKAAITLLEIICKQAAAARRMQ